MRMMTHHVLAKFRVSSSDSDESSAGSVPERLL